MKLYGYAIVKYRNDDDSCIFYRISFTQEVKEYPGGYENAEPLKTFYSNWDNFLPKSELGKVQKDIYCTNIKYLIYLLEDDKVKAMSLIKQYIQKEIDELNKKINNKQELLGVTCGPINEIKEM